MFERPFVSPSLTHCPLECHKPMAVDGQGNQEYHSLFTRAGCPHASPIAQDFTYLGKEIRDSPPFAHSHPHEELK